MPKTETQSGATEQLNANESSFVVGDEYAPYFLPDITQYEHFGMQDVKCDAGGSVSDGGTVSYVIPRAGDVVMHAYLRARVADGFVRTAWAIESAIDTIRVFIGDVAVDEYDRQYIRLHYSHVLDEAGKAKWDKMTSGTGYAGGDLFMPLLFGFCTHRDQVLPLAGLSDQHVRVEIKWSDNASSFVDFADVSVFASVAMLSDGDKKRIIERNEHYLTDTIYNDARAVDAGNVRVPTGLSNMVKEIAWSVTAGADEQPFEYDDDAGRVWLGTGAGQVIEAGAPCEMFGDSVVVSANADRMFVSAPRAGISSDFATALAADFMGYGRVGVYAWQPGGYQIDEDIRPYDDGRYMPYSKQAYFPTTAHAIVAGGTVAFSSTPVEDAPGPHASTLTVVGNAFAYASSANAYALDATIDVPPGSLEIVATDAGAVETTFPYTGAAIVVSGAALGAAPGTITVRALVDVSIPAGGVVRCAQVDLPGAIGGVPEGRTHTWANGVTQGAFYGVFGSGGVSCNTDGTRVLINTSRGLGGSRGVYMYDRVPGLGDNFNYRRRLSDADAAIDALVSDMSHDGRTCAVLTANSVDNEGRLRVYAVDDAGGAVATVDEKISDYDAARYAWTQSVAVSGDGTHVAASMPNALPYGVEQYPSGPALDGVDGTCRVYANGALYDTIDKNSIGVKATQRLPRGFGFASKLSRSGDILFVTAPYAIDASYSGNVGSIYVFKKRPAIGKYTLIQRIDCAAPSQTEFGKWIEIDDRYVKHLSVFRNDYGNGTSPPGFVDFYKNVGTTEKPVFEYDRTNTSADWNPVLDTATLAKFGSPHAMSQSGTVLAVGNRQYRADQLTPVVTYAVNDPLGFTKGKYFDTGPQDGRVYVYTVKPPLYTTTRNVPGYYALPAIYSQPHKSTGVVRITQTPLRGNVASARLNTRGGYINARHDEKYYNVVQPFYHHTGCAAPGNYAFSWALKPELTQPTGAINGTVIMDDELDMEVAVDGTVNWYAHVATIMSKKSGAVTLYED